MSVKVRFAPSPTGFLHVGNVRAALINWMFAKKHHGEFMLRMDDTDLERSTKAFEDGIIEDLAWLGLYHKSFARQSERFERYGEVMQQLISSGRLYPCYETPEELEFKRKRQLGRGEPPRYDRAALKLTDAEKKAFEAEGRTPHYRFLLESKDIRWHDLVRGDVHFAPDHLSDPVLVRGDGAYLYTHTSVIDDIDFGITHILRGEDHVTNTAVQVQLFEALGKNPNEIQFAHTTLLMDKDGSALSKRLGSLGVKDLRAEGIEPLAICGFMARLGTSLPIQPFFTMEEIADQFDLSTFSRNPPRFDIDELRSLNHKLMAELPFSVMQPKLVTMGFGDFQEREWDLFKGNILSKDDFALWHTIFHGEIKLPHDLDREYIKIALTNLPHDPFTETTWKAWTDTLKAETGRKGKDLFMPLRQALTGEDHGPEMKDILPLLGYHKAKIRLEKAAS